MLQRESVNISYLHEKSRKQIKYYDTVHLKANIFILRKQYGSYDAHTKIIVSWQQIVLCGVFIINY
jgi:hypothetical protein